MRYKVVFVSLKGGVARVIRTMKFAIKREAVDAMPKVRNIAKDGRTYFCYIE
jgi:hypothetical protein